MVDISSSNRHQPAAYHSEIRSDAHADYYSNHNNKQQPTFHPPSVDTKSGHHPGDNDADRKFRQAHTPKHCNKTASNYTGGTSLRSNY